MSSQSNIIFSDGFETSNNLSSILSLIPSNLNGLTQIPFSTGLTSESNNALVPTLNQIPYLGDGGWITAPNVTSFPVSNVILSLSSVIGSNNSYGGATRSLLGTPQPTTGSPGFWATALLGSALQNYSIPSGSTTPTLSFTNYSSLVSAITSAWSTGTIANERAYANSFGTVTPATIGTTQTNALYQGLLDDFATAMGIQLDANNNIIGGDWLMLTQSPPTPPVLAANAFADPNSPTNPFIQVMNKFLSTYTYPPENTASNGTFANNANAGGAGNGAVYTGYINNAAAFINQFHQFLTGAATINDAQTNPGSVYVDPSVSSNPFVNLNSYQAYYNAFVPGATPAGFQSFLDTFYQNQVSTNGYFMPSTSFLAFTQAVNAINPSGTSGGSSSISGTDSSKAAIINRILALLISIINTLQNVGIAEANNLTFLTQYQNAYTALLQQVPTFLADNTTPIGLSGNGNTIATNDRNDLNSTFNGILSDNLRALQNVQSNQAKTVQANLNTTNDAVNQQTDMATTFLQQMTTLLGVIFQK